MNHKLVLTLAVSGALAGLAGGVYAQEAPKPDGDKKELQQIVQQPEIALPRFIAEGDDEKKDSKSDLIAEGDDEKKDSKPELIAEGDDEKKDAPKPELIAEGDDEKKDAPKPELIAEGDDEKKDAPKPELMLS